MTHRKRSPKLRDLKEMWLRQALAETEGSPTETAKVLDISRATVYRWMKRYGVAVRKGVEDA